MANPLVFTTGTSTANVAHAIKLTKAELLSGGTAATALVTDINGNVFVPQMTVAAAAGSVQVLDYAVPMILPGGSLAQPLTGAATNFLVTVTGAAATLYLTHR